jgi:hypothetical protein
MHRHSQQTFFVPKLHTQKTSILAADSFNLAHILLNRSESEYLFVPIRSMQYLAVIEPHDFWFVDSQAYAVSDSEGGRMITISWHSHEQLQRDALDQPVPITIRFYHQDMNQVQLRLSGELLRAMQQLDQRYREQQIPAEGARIIEWKGRP